MALVLKLCAVLAPASGILADWKQHDLLSRLDVADGSLLAALLLWATAELRDVTLALEANRFLAPGALDHWTTIVRRPANSRFPVSSPAAGQTSV